MATQPQIPVTNPVNDPRIGKDATWPAEDQKVIIPEKDPWSDSRAAAIAIGDFRKDEIYRQQNHDWRFRVADQLYLAWVPKKTWEGTKIPRASVAIHLVFEQLEALLPSLISSLFPDENKLSFDVEPEVTSSIEQANSVRDLLHSQIRNLGDRAFVSLRELLLRATKNKLLYGNLILEFGWINKKETRETWSRQQVPVRQPMALPGGQVAHVPTGRMSSFLQHTVQDLPVSKPIVQSIDPRDFYWDANCNSSNIQDAGHCEHRSMPTINDLLQYRGQEGFNIPDEATLLELAHQKKSTQADNSKQQTEVYRGMTWSPTIDQSVDPNLARVELIRYWQKNRHVWIIRGFESPLYNQANKYGVLPFITEAYVEVPGRFAGISLADLCETDQKLVETIINARLDELALLIHPPIVKKRGVALPLSQQRVRPGVIWESDDPKNDYVKSDWGNTTAQAFVEVDAAERRTQKKTGVTDLAVLGTPAAGGNSANRTATGIQSQGAASGKRIQFQVENSEDRVIVPLLNALHSMNQKFLDPQQLINIVGQDGQNLQIDPVDILNASVRFTLTASGRMRQKQAMMNGGIQVILETVLNPALMQELQAQGIAPNLLQINNLVCDAINIPRKSLFRQMSPQEMQAAQQAQNSDAMIRMQMQQDRLQSQSQNQESSDETKLLISLLKQFLTPQAAHEMINKMLGTSLDTHSGKEPAPKGIQ